MQKTFFHSKIVRYSAVTFLIGTFLGSATVTIGQSLLGSSRFTDVEFGSFYDAAVGELAGLGIINGYDATHFGPNDPVTRGQIAVLMKRLRDELKGITPASSSTSSRRSSSSSQRSVSSSASSEDEGASEAGSIRFASGAYSADENQGTLQIKLIRSVGTTGEVSVHYVIEAGTATAGSDYVADSGDLTLGDGQVERIITVRLMDDAVSESEEKFTVRLSGPTGGVILGAVSSATVTIKDNDASSSAGGSSTNTVTFSALEYMVRENAGSMTVRIVRSATGGTMSVNYATSNDTALTPADYTEKSGTVTFAAGESMKEATITLSDDTGREGNETFKMTLSSATNGVTIKNPVAKVIIVDDETVEFGTGSLRLIEEEYRVSEKDTVVDVVVERFGGAAGTVNVQYQTAGGTATAGSDYTLAVGTLVFLPGESKKIISIKLMPDSALDDYETIILVLSNPTGGAPLVDPKQTEVTIVE
ncbi:MAG: Calx-beta domain-containing protein [Candidatus Peribacteraceae bacterium]|nr:Calx-beta domain-containing protein [Candidatus Peribacteraceae bacterium]